MKNSLRLLMFILVIPVVSGVLAWATIAKLEGMVREEIRRNNPDIPSEALDKVTIAQLAANGAFANDELPALDRHLRWARATAIGSATLGLCLMAAIAWAGRATRTNRELLLKVFRPGLYVTLLSVGLLTAAQAIAAAYSVYYFESIFVERVHMILILGVAAGGLLALVAVIRAIFTLFRTVDQTVLGKSVTRSEQPRLWAAVDEVCKKLNANPPQHIVLGLEPTYFVTEADTKCGGTLLRGRTLFVSLAYGHLLDLAEFKAVIGHEMAHFIGEDTKFSQRFFPVYRGTIAALHNLARNEVHGSVAIAQMPAVAFLSYFLESFMLTEKALSRERETAADALGASIGDATCLATALVKVHAMGEGWQKVLTDVAYNNEGLRDEANLSNAFVQGAKTVTTEMMVRAGEMHQPHPTDSHPTLVDRLTALNVDLAAAIAAVRVPSPDDAAAALVANSAEIEIQQSVSLRAELRPA